MTPLKSQSLKYGNAQMQGKTETRGHKVEHGHECVYTQNLHLVANACTHGVKRAYTRSQTCLHVEANEFTRVGKRVQVIPWI